ncbi:MAG: DUF177 domain-containing protein [Oscillospiraceae bacterium]|nr:DUF177 domain-containing protein [Oscillospiraceae bacterium]
MRSVKEARRQMLMNVKAVLNIPGTEVPVDCAVSPERLETVTQIHGYRFVSPLTLKGVIRNRAGVATLQAQVACTLELTCDRCLKPFTRDFCYEGSHVIVRNLDNADEEDADMDDYVIARAESIDTDEIAVSDLVLELPSKMLCREDCKGLCPVCGADRNEVDCGHMSE